VPRLIGAQQLIAASAATGEEIMPTYVPPTDSSVVLSTLLMCGLMGLLGQGVRAAVGLKKASALGSGTPSQQSEFNAAYLLISLMIGFIAGVLAGLAIGLTNLVKLDLNDMKVLLGIAAAGYAGADFIENTFSIILPSPKSAAPAAAADANVQALGGHVNALTAAVSSMTKNLAALPSGAAPPAPAPADVIPGLGDALKSVAPNVNPNIWLPALSAAFTKFDMVSHKRIAAAVGQFLVEAGSAFQEVVENLRYTHASRIVAVFPNEFPTVADAQPFVDNPEALGNRAYANKLGNGDEVSGDGFRFRGRGLIQLTGRDEYTGFGTTIGMTAEQAAQFCETPAGAAMSGCFYLASRGCLPLADVWALSKITRKVNGAAMLGNKERIDFSNAMLQALGG
jgi:predicted chitinase